MAVDLLPGDYVSVQVSGLGSREGTIVGTSYDNTGRQVISVRLTDGETYSTWVPFVTRLKRRTTYFPAYSPLRWIERTVYW